MDLLNRDQRVRQHEALWMPVKAHERIHSCLHQIREHQRRRIQPHQPKTLKSPKKVSMTGLLRHFSDSITAKKAAAHQRR